LGYSPEEHPIALQLGGSEPETLAEAVRIAVPFGYDEINLNVGCPSDRVQSGAFGACLMRESELVARCCEAMIAASDAAGGPEITVKCRIGVDEQDPDVVLPAFLQAISSAGIRAVTIHARKAWLKGLSPKENRDIPPLDYALVRRMKDDFPGLQIVLNGGVTSIWLAATHLTEGFDGVMIGRAAYHHPIDVLGRADNVIFDAESPPADPFKIARAMIPYAETRLALGDKLSHITRHMLGLFHGAPGARGWRRILTVAAAKAGAAPELIETALEGIAPFET
jgi:tRNA-dihydrouridine synthase A